MRAEALACIAGVYVAIPPSFLTLLAAVAEKEHVSISVPLRLLYEHCRLPFIAGTKGQVIFLLFFFFFAMDFYIILKQGNSPCRAGLFPLERMLAPHLNSFFCETPLKQITAEVRAG